MSATSVRRPRLVGTATPGATVLLLAPDGDIIAAAVASSPGGGYTLQTAFNLGTAAIPLRKRRITSAASGRPDR